MHQEEEEEDYHHLEEVLNQELEVAVVLWDSFNLFVFREYITNWKTTFNERASVD
jgi:hypothetical protein